MKCPLLLAVILLASQHSFAQRIDPNTKPPANPTPTPAPQPKQRPSLDISPTSNVPAGPSAPRPVKYPVTAQLLLGTQGIGLEGRVGIKPRLFARLGGAYLPANLTADVRLRKLDTKVNADTRFSNIHLLAEYQPFLNRDWFRVVGGLGYFFTAHSDITMTPESAQRYGDIMISPGLLGGMKGEADWSGIAPYLGLGLLRAFPYDRFSINLDAGTYMLSKPKVHLDGYGALEDNSHNSAIIESNMSDYRWLPVLQLNFTYKIR